MYYVCMNMCMCVHTHAHTDILGVGLKSRKITEGIDSLSCTTMPPYSEIRKKISNQLWVIIIFSVVEKITLEVLRQPFFFCRKSCSMGFRVNVFGFQPALCSCLQTQRFQGNTFQSLSISNINNSLFLGQEILYKKSGTRRVLNRIVLNT